MTKFPCLDSGNCNILKDGAKSPINNDMLLLHNVARTHELYSFQSRARNYKKFVQTVTGPSTIVTVLLRSSLMVLLMSGKMFIVSGSGRDDCMRAEATSSVKRPPRATCCC